jgi:GH15 family glucan-1,4-alpha-glucosidase
MITFIIPTVYMAETMPYLLDMLNFHPLVDEIILIENAKSKIKLPKYKKLKVVNTGTNLMCNKSWNMGASLTKSKYYALCNDDILFNQKIIDEVISFYDKHDEVNLIGMDFTQLESEIEPHYFGFRVQRDRDFGWGTLIFGKTNLYTPIPEDLIHYAGDEYLHQYSPKPCYSYLGFKVFGKMSTSKDYVSNFDDLVNNDLKIYKEKYILDKPKWV